MAGIVEAASARPMPSAPPDGQLALDLGPPPPPSFGNFVAGANTECLARLQALAAGDRAQRFLYLWGPSGCGRSHLLASLAAECGAATTAAVPPTSAASTATTTAAPITVRLGPLGVVSERGSPNTPLSAYAAGLDTPGTVTLLDDAHLLDAVRQEAAFHRYVAAQQDARAAFVATGDAPPLALALREDLRTRLGGALVLRLEPLTDEDKRAALAQAAHERGVTISPEVLDYMLLHLPRDLRVLMATLDALDRYALEKKRAITMPLLREFSQRRLPLSDAG